MRKKNFFFQRKWWKLPGKWVKMSRHLQKCTWNRLFEPWRKLFDMILTLIFCLTGRWIFASFEWMKLWDKKVFVINVLCMMLFVTFWWLWNFWESCFTDMIYGSTESSDSRPFVLSKWQNGISCFYGWLWCRIVSAHDSSKYEWMFDWKSCFRFVSFFSFVIFSIWWKFIYSINRF